MSDLLLLLAGLGAGALAAAGILLPRLRRSRATVTLLEAQLAASRRERETLAAELAGARDEAGLRGAAIASENDELRRRMDELADLLMRAGSSSGEASHERR